MKEIQPADSGMAVLLLLILQHRFYHGKCKSLFAGRSIFPECSISGWYGFRFLPVRLVEDNPARFSEPCKAMNTDRLGIFTAALNLPEDK